VTSIRIVVGVLSIVYPKCPNYRQRYTLEFTTDFVSWREVNDSIPSGGSPTTFLVTGEEATGPAGYYRVYPTLG